jgi:hypothetical protein
MMRMAGAPMLGSVVHATASAGLAAINISGAVDKVPLTELVFVPETDGLGGDSYGGCGEITIADARTGRALA